MNKGFLLLLGLLSGPALAQNNAQVNPTAGDVWTYYGPTLGAGWSPVPLTGSPWVFPAQNYGNCQWDGTGDITPCVHLARDAAKAAGSGNIVLPSGSLRVVTPINIPSNYDNINIIGGGGGGSFLRCGTTLDWQGAPGDTILQVGDDSGTVVGNQVTDLCLFGNLSAAKALRLVSVNNGNFERLFMYNPTTAALSLEMSASNAAALGYNHFERILITVNSGASDGLVFQPQKALVRDVHENVFENITINVKDGIAFNCYGSDTNTFINARFAATGTGKGAVFRGESASTYSCRRNFFYTTMFFSDWVVEGTDTPGVTTPSDGNWIFGTKQGDGEVNPTMGTGATLYGWDSLGRRIPNSSPIYMQAYPPQASYNASDPTLVHNNCGTAIDNQGTSGARTFTLPAATGSYCEFEFNKTNSGSTVTIQTAAAPDIICGAGSDVHCSSSGGSITTNRVYSTVRIKDVDTNKWVVKSGTGYWLTDTGMPIGIGGMTLFNSLIASSTASLEFTSLPALVDTFLLTCSALVPATDGVDLRLQVSTDNGGTWKAANYTYAMVGVNTGGAVAPVSSTVGNSILINASAINSSATNPLSFKAYLHNLGSSTANKIIQYESAYENNAANAHESITGSGKYTGDQAVVNAFRLIFSSGPIASGQCGLYAAVP